MQHSFSVNSSNKCRYFNNMSHLLMRLAFIDYTFLLLNLFLNHSLCFLLYLVTFYSTYWCYCFLPEWWCLLHLMGPISCCWSFKGILLYGLLLFVYCKEIVMLLLYLLFFVMFFSNNKQAVYQQNKTQ